MEFIYFDSRPQLAKCVCNCINGCGYISSGVMSSSSLVPGSIANRNCKTHISNNCYTAMFNLQRIKYICMYLTKEACQTFVHGLVMSHLDYTNSFCVHLPDIEINRLQHVQNAVAKLVTRRMKYDSWAQSFIYLHWLPIRKRIIHKILTLVYNTRFNLPPRPYHKMSTTYSWAQIRKQPKMPGSCND